MNPGLNARWGVTRFFKNRSFQTFLFTAPTCGTGSGVGVAVQSRKNHHLYNTRKDLCETLVPCRTDLNNICNKGFSSVRKFCFLPRAVESIEEASSHPKIPLCERNPSHIVSRSALLEWHRQAIDKIDEVGNSLSEDGGPELEELHVELEWLMEDAVGEAAPIDSNASGLTEWISISWKDVARGRGVMEGSTSSTSDTLLKLRLSLNQLRTYLSSGCYVVV